jgi:hypothetical protein
VPEAEIVTFPGGHLLTSEHPDLLAAAIGEIAARHGVGVMADAPLMISNLNVEKGN